MQKIDYRVIFLMIHLLKSSNEFKSLTNNSKKVEFDIAEAQANVKNNERIINPINTIPTNILKY